MRLAALLLAASCAWGQPPCILMQAGGQQVCVQPGNGMSLRGDLFALDVNVYTDPMFIKFSNDVSLALSKLNSTSTQPFQPPVFVSQFTPQQATDIGNMVAYFQTHGWGIMQPHYRQAVATQTAAHTWAAPLKPQIASGIDETAWVMVQRNGVFQRNGYDFTIAASADRMSLVVSDATQTNILAGVSWPESDIVLLIWIE